MQKYLILPAFAVLSATAIAPAPAQAKDAFPAGRQVEEISLSCSDSNLVVIGEFEDIQVDLGQSDWTEIQSAKVEYFCGTFQGEFECPAGTEAVRVNRTSRWALVMQCYRE